MVIGFGFALFTWHGAGLDALAGDHALSLVASGFHQFLRPWLEAQAVGDQQLCLQQVFGVRWLGHEYVRIFIRTDQRCHGNAVADHLHQITQNTEARQDRHFVRRDGGKSCF